MTRIEREKRIVEQMIAIYCRKHEGNAQLCDDCRALLKYALQRLSKCPWGNNKGSCRKCPTHCYRPHMKERIRAVMRYSGPRMILYNPVAAFKHLLD